MSERDIDEVVTECLCYSDAVVTATTDAWPTLAATDGKRVHASLDEARARLAAGESVELEVGLRTYRQVDGERNRNNVRFRPTILRRLARSYKGAPLLRDHEQGDLTARAGTITEAEAVKVDGGVAFDMQARVTAPWAVDALLRGNLDRFSIGWAHGGLDTIYCSECNTPIFTSCGHMPGDKITDEKAGETRVVEFVFHEAEGVEVSAVSIPAVRGTGIADVRMALSAAMQLRRTAVTTNAATTLAEQEADMSKITKTLGLDEGADEETVLSAIQARDATIASLSQSNESLNTELSDWRSADNVRRIDALFAEHADRLPLARDAKGERVASPCEINLRALAARDYRAAESILSTMPRLAPVLGERLTAVLPPICPPPIGKPWDEIIESQLRQMGISRDDYEKFCPTWAVEVYPRARS